VFPPPLSPKESNLRKKKKKNHIEQPTVLIFSPSLKPCFDLLPQQQALERSIPGWTTCSSETATYITAAPTSSLESPLLVGGRCWVI
jgi:hypothetical protein